MAFFGTEVGLPIFIKVNYVGKIFPENPSFMTVKALSIVIPIRQSKSIDQANAIVPHKPIQVDAAHFLYRIP